MKIRRQSDPEFNAVRYDGDLNSLVTWLVNRPDFISVIVKNDLSIVVNVINNSFTMITGDYMRVKEDNTLDRISAANFTNAWEVVP